MTVARISRAIVIFAYLLGILLQRPGSHAQSLNDLLRVQPFTARRASSADPSGGNLDMRRVVAGQSLTLAELEGPGVITHIWFTHLYPSRSSLRKLVLRIYFENMAQPCVEAPLGDFFGLGHSLTYAYGSQPLAVGTHGGLNSYWPMPFATKARLVVANEGAQDCPALYFQIDYRKLEQPLPDGLHFFAAYRQAFPPAKGEPYEILQTAGGQGHFAGCNLSVEQQDEGWWGEGDVAMFVDGESKPSMAGTGSEDDFGGAWCYSHEFGYAQFGAPLRARFNARGILEHCTADLKGKDLAQWRWPEAWKPGDLWNVYRYHIADPVPFRNSLRVTMEHGWQNNERADWYSSVAYWYQTGQPPARARLPAVSDRLPRYLRPHDHGSGQWEAEDLVDAATTTGGKIEEAGMEFWGDLFSGQYALAWDAQNTNDTLTLSFSVVQTGRYKVDARLSRVEAGGTFKLQVDDLPAPEPLNLFQPPPVPALFEATVAAAELKAGSHALKFTALPPDTRAKGKRLLLDKLEVIAAPK
jgi:hypothetical protein